MSFSNPSIGTVTAFIDSAPESERSAFVASYVRSLDLHSEAEFALATAAAEARWRLARLSKLEASLVSNEIHRQKALRPNEHPTAHIALALLSSNEQCPARKVIDFLEFRYHCQYARARAGLRRLRLEAAAQYYFSKQSEPKIGNLRTPAAPLWHPAKRTGRPQLPIIELSNRSEDSL